MDSSPSASDFSRLVAHSLSIEHKHLLETVCTYLAQLETLGQLPFQTAVGYQKQGSGNPTKYALLNEGLQEATNVLR
ncbi:MAG TPA: hypothetical protein VF458_02980 [Ktedonobacteraceae bacterium]